MKQIKLLLVTLLVTGFSFAQTNNEDVDLFQAAFGMQKKEVVTKYMTIPDLQKDQFWAVYDEYETERKSSMKNVIALVEDYAKSYESITDEQAKDLMKRKLSINADQVKLQKKYFDKIAKVVGAKQSAKFFQLEDYFLNLIKLSIQSEIPYIGELNDAVKK